MAAAATSLAAVACSGSSDALRDACTVGARHCSEWVLVLAPGTPPTDVQAWLQARGWAVRRRVDELRMLMVWLPVGVTGEAAGRIRLQAWAELLTPAPRPPAP